MIPKCGISKRKQIVTSSGNAFLEVIGKNIQERQNPKACN
jgi:hypothetical protein